MPNYSYLMKYFQENDRILLYGGGKNGREIYQFLKGRRQLRPVGLIDQNAGRLDGWDIPVYRPDQLKIIPPETYDKLLITVMSQNAGLEIYRIIQEAGIESEKIIAPYTYLGLVTSLTPEDFAGDGLPVKREIKRFLDEQYGSLFFFEPLIQTLKGLSGQRNTLLPQAKKVLDRLSPLESVVFLYVLYSANAFDAELMERLMDCLLEIDDIHLRQFLYGAFIDTTYFCFYHEEYLFPNFYIKRRGLLKKVCEMLDFSVPKYSKRQNGRRCIKKISIVSRCFHVCKRDADATILLCIQLANQLAGWGYDIQLILLDPISYLMETPVFPPLFQWYDTSSSYIAEYKRELPPQVSIINSDEYDLKGRLQNALDGIFSYSPDLIIDISDEMSVLSYLYSQYFHTLYLPMRGYQSSSYFTYFAVMSYQAFEEANRIYHSVGEPQAVELPLLVAPPLSENAYSRTQYSLLDDDFVMVTVGARLNNDMSEEFIDVVCKRLSERSKLKWLIVGSKSEYLSETYQRCLDEHKIIYIPYEYDLPALYKICDVYLNPKRQGGGTSFCWAMYDMPLAMVRMPCDQADTVGLENMIDGTYEQVMDYVLEMQRNPEFYAEEREKFRQRILCFETKKRQSWKRIIKTLKNKANI